MTRWINVLLHQHAIVVERRHGLTPRRHEGLRELGRGAYLSHPLTTTAARGFSTNNPSCIEVTITLPLAKNGYDPHAP